MLVLAILIQFTGNTSSFLMLSLGTVAVQASFLLWLGSYCASSLYFSLLAPTLTRGLVVHITVPIRYLKTLEFKWCNSDRSCICAL